MIVTVSYMLRDLGYDYFDRSHKDALARRMTRRLERLSFRVTIEPAA